MAVKAISFISLLGKKEIWENLDLNENSVGLMKATTEVFGEMCFDYVEFEVIFKNWNKMIQFSDLISFTLSFPNSCIQNTGKNHIMVYIFSCL